MVERISSLDVGYQTGELSVYPEAIDDKDTLYQATNNAWIQLKQTLTYTGKIIVVEDTSAFPATGLLRIGPAPGENGEYEMVYYGRKTSTTFQDLIRGYSGSKQSHWVSKRSFVSNAVASEHHNAIKDAIIRIEDNFGLVEEPTAESLNGILKAQEVRFLSPKPLFRAYPIKGPPPLRVRFQNFSTGYIIRYLWDFGDGGTSLEESPTHTYSQEGVYSVKLNIVTSTGAQGVATKRGYIQVDADETTPFFYAEPGILNREYVFIDQSDGDIVQRNWVFGDGEKYTEEDPDIHTVRHVYAQPGQYVVTELIQFANGRLKRVELPEPLVVL